jgi:hypothetical protein
VLRTDLERFRTTFGFKHSKTCPFKKGLAEFDDWEFVVDD